MAEKPISGSEIVEKDALKPTIADGEQLIVVLDKLEQRFINVMKASKGDLANNPKTAAEFDALAKAIKKVEDAEKGLMAVQKVRTVEQHKLQVQAQEQNKINKELAKDQLGLISAYQKASRSLNDMRKAYKDLAIQNKENTKEGRELLKNITELDAKLKRVDATVGQHQRNVGNYTSALSGLAAQLGVTLSVGSVVAFGKASFESFAEAQKNANNLRLAIESMTGGKEGQGAFVRLIELSERLQNEGIFSDDDIQKASTLAVQFGLNSKAVEELIPAVADFAAQTSQELEPALEAILKGINGNGKALKLYGIEVDSSKTKQEQYGLILQQLTKFQGANAAQLDTAAGQVRRFENAIDDLKESVGEFIVEQGNQLIDIFEVLSGKKSVADVGISKLNKFLEERNKVVLENAEKGSELLKAQALAASSQRLSALQQEFLKSNIERRKFVQANIDAEKRLNDELRKIRGESPAGFTDPNHLTPEERERRLKEAQKANQEYWDMISRIGKEALDAQAKATRDAAAKDKEEQDKADKDWKERTDKNTEIFLANLERMEKAKKDAAEAEEKARKKRQKETEEAIEGTQKLTDAIAEGLEKRNQKAQDAEEQRLSDAERNIELQQERAAQGLTNTLAFEESERAKSLARQAELEEQAARREEAQDLAEIFYEYLKGFAKDGKEGGASKALAQTIAARAIANGLAGNFAEGVENFQGKGTETSDSNIIGFSKGESVITAAGTKENPGLATAMNEGKVDEWMRENWSGSHDNIVQDVSKESQVEQVLVTIVAKELRKINKTIKDKPEYGVTVNQVGQIVETILKDGKRSEIIHNKGWFRK